MISAPSNVIVVGERVFGAVSRCTRGSRGGLPAPLDANCSG